jgi:hypothetical protein
MQRLFLILSASLFTLLFARAGDGDPIKDKLAKAKATYEKEVEKFKKDMTTSFDKREEAARKSGDKKRLDQIKAERKAFEDDGETPATAPKVVRQRLATARATVEKAYETAIKEYTMTKNDEAAAAVEKDLAAFRKMADPSDVRRRWVHDKGSYTLQNGGIWEEKSPDGNTYKWKETARTKNYVELQADIFGVPNIVHLTDTGAEYQSGKDTAFKKKFSGKWAD